MTVKLNDRFIPVKPNQQEYKNSKYPKLITFR